MNFRAPVDVKRHRIVLLQWSQFVPNMSTDIRGDEVLLHHQDHSHFLGILQKLFPFTPSQMLIPRGVRRGRDTESRLHITII